MCKDEGNKEWIRNFGGEISCKTATYEVDWVGGRWIELAQDRIKWCPLILVILNLRFLLPQRWLTINTQYASFLSNLSTKSEYYNYLKFVSNVT
jgi:hypothetical protein